MKIFVNARFLTQPISGVQRYGIECSRQIKKLYNKIVFLTPKNILHNEIAEELGAIVTGINTGHMWEQSDLPLYLYRNGGGPLFSPANTAPVVYNNNYFTLHDLAFYHHPEWNSKAFSAWYNLLEPKLARRSKHIFTVSETMRREIIKDYEIPGDKVTVTYNGLSEQMLAARTGKDVVKEKIVLAVGTFNKRKNHQNLVKAFAASKIKEDYQLVIIGDKNRVFAESGVDERLLREANIKIYDRLTTEELIIMYLKAEILVSLSVYEGFGIPVLEGLYSGCKVICSDIAVYRELYDSYVSFCDPQNIESISRSLSEVADGLKLVKNVNELPGQYNYARSAKIILEEMTKSAGAI